MADNNTKFASVVPLGTAANVAQALDIYRVLTAQKDAEGEIIGFDGSHRPLLAEAGLFLSADGDLFPNAHPAAPGSEPCRMRG